MNSVYPHNSIPELKFLASHSGTERFAVGIVFVSSLAYADVKKQAAVSEKSREAPLKRRSDAV